MFYGSSLWDPVLILAQIITIQCLFYVSQGLLLWLLLGPYVVKLNMHHFFDWQWVSFHSFNGWMIVVANLLNGLAAAGYLVFIVERAKKCLDFAATAYIINFIGVCVYSGFPRNFEWWLVNILGLTIMAMLGEWLCLQRELREIPVGSLRARSPGGASNDVSKGVSSSSIPGAGSTTASMRLAAGANNV